MFRRQVNERHIALRIVVALAPFLAILLWVRNWFRWIRGLNELHRRITVAATFFATSASFILVMIWHRLGRVVFGSG